MTTAMLIRHTARRATAMRILYPVLRPATTASHSFEIVQGSGAECTRGLQLNKLIGTGMFGSTYEGTYNRATADDIVCKIVQLNRPDTGELGGTAMFEAEVAAALAASTLGVGPKLHKCWRCDSRGYMVMERCVPLGSMSHTDLQLVAVAVYALAEFGLMHNDLHGDNIMRHARTSEPVLIDFGMATTIGASSGYRQVMRLKAIHSISTSAAATLLTMQELGPHVKKLNTSDLISLVDSARRRALHHSGSLPALDDMVSLMPDIKQEK